MSMFNREKTESDARRLTAAWNACEGIPTEALEAGAVRRLVEAATDLLGNYRCFVGGGFSPPGSVGDRLEKALAALTPKERSDG